jgi:hypothetical protein
LGLTSYGNGVCACSINHGGFAVNSKGHPASCILPPSNQGEVTQKQLSQRGTTQLGTFQNQLRNQQRRSPKRKKTLTVPLEIGGICLFIPAQNFTTFNKASSNSLVGEHPFSPPGSSEGGSRRVTMCASNGISSSVDENQVFLLRLWEKTTATCVHLNQRTKGIRCEDVMGKQGSEDTRT